MKTLVRSFRTAFVLAAGTLAAFAAPAGAQEWGVKVGASRSTMMFENGGTLSDGSDVVIITDGQAERARRGFAAGLFARFPIAGRVSLQPEALYVQKGFEETRPTLHVEYLELPLLLRVDLAELGGSVQPFVLAGPALAVQLHRSYSGGPCVDPVPLCELDVDVLVTEYDDPRMDLGVAVGGGLAVRAGPGRVVLEARHTRGLRDAEIEGVRGTRSLNHANTLTLGYALPLRLPFRK